MAQTYLQALASDARCFSCLTGQTKTQVQAYIVAFTTGLGVDPAAWAIRVKCLNCLTLPELLQVRIYLLATLAGFTTDAASLVRAATCYACFEHGEIATIQTYLLAQDPFGPGITEPKALSQVVSGFRKFNAKTLLQIEVFALATNAGLSTDPSALLAVAKCMPCVPFPLLAAVALEVIDFLEPIPADSPRVNLPPPTPPPAPGGGPPPGRGGGVPGCTDTLANLTPVITAHYVAGNITTIDILVPRTCCKKSSFELFGSNAADMSGAVLVTGGSNPNKTVNWTMAGIDVSLAGFKYYAAQSVCVGGLTSPFSNIVLSVDGSAIANAWANRVVTNGGAMPSVNSINACETFVESLMLAGIWSKMVCVNMVAPDSLTAALTPLVVGGGRDPWLQTSANDITVNGIKGAGACFIQTGVIPSNNPFPAFSFGFVAYNYESFTAQSQYSMACAVVNSFALGHTNTGEWDLEMPFPDAQLIVAGAVNWKGYSSGQRIANNDLKCYRASSTVPWAQVGTSAAVTLDRRASVTVEFYAICENANGVPAAQSNVRHSFFAWTQGLTGTEDHALYNAVQALRTAFGGGFV